jgi:hypothetical protein
MLDIDRHLLANAKLLWRRELTDAEQGFPASRAFHPPPS